MEGSELPSRDWLPLSSEDMVVDSVEILRCWDSLAVLTGDWLLLTSSVTAREFIEYKLTAELCRHWLKPSRGFKSQSNLSRLVKNEQEEGPNSDHLSTEFQ